VTQVNIQSDSMQASADLVISFCNQTSSPSQSLCLMELVSGNIRWIDLSQIPVEFRTNFVGVTGVCLAEDRIVISTQGPRPVLALLDGLASKVIEFSPLVRCKDPHSIVFHRDHIYVTSTGTNEIYRVSLHNKKFGEEELYWQYPDVRYDQDEIHLNGLTLNNARLIASCFGEKIEIDQWGKSGRVFYIDNGFNIIDGLSQPHSPVIKNGRLVFAESKLERVWVFVEEGVDSWVFERYLKLDGYARGVALLKHEIVVGISADRKVSRSRQTYLDEAIQLRPAALIVINNNSNVNLNYPKFEFFGREIYDVLPVNVPCHFDSIEVSILERLRSMEAIILSHGVSNAKLIAEKSQLIAEKSQLIADKLVLSGEYQLVLDEYNALKIQCSKSLRRKLITWFKSALKGIFN